MYFVHNIGPYFKFYLSNSVTKMSTKVMHSLAHFQSGLRLPMDLFLGEVIDELGVQLTYLLPNIIRYMTYFIALCWGLGWNQPFICFSCSFIQYK